MESLLDQTQIQYLIRTKYAFLTPDQFDTFCAECRRRGLDPWMRHVCPKIVRDAETGEQELKLFTTIDALRVLANRTGNYGAQVGPHWCGPDGEWKDLWNLKEPPYAARVRVYRKGIDVPFDGIAYWEAHAQWTVENRGQRRYSEFWHRMGPHMLSIRAEAIGLRKAHPETLAGLYLAGEPAEPAPPGPRTMRIVSDDPHEPVLVLD